MNAFAAVNAPIEVTETLIVTLLLIASVVAIASSYLKVPYTVALVVSGLVLGVSGAFAGVSLSEPLIVLLFLPPLVFEGVLNVHFDELRRRWLQIGLLAVIGTVISAAVIGGLLLLIPGMPLPAALLLAVILAPTDPVSVLAIFKANGVNAGLQTLLEGESLFNDALGIVLYVVAVDLAFPPGHPVTMLDGLREFVQEISVGILLGTIVGLLAHRLMATLSDHLIEIALSLVTAYGSFLAADRLGGSGIIATVVAGLLIGNFGTERSMTERSRQALKEFWEVIAFLANSALFLLIGLDFDLADLIEKRTLVAAGIALLGMAVARAFATWTLLSPFRDRHRLGQPPVPHQWFPAVFWGGLRGGIPIALVLGLEGRKVGGTNTEALVFGVVLVSLIAQGLSYKPLLRRQGLLVVAEPTSAIATGCGDC